MSEHPLLLLIDGHALAFRAFHALAEAGLRASSGEPTYAVYGFTSIMLNAVHEYHPEYIVVTFDIGRTFRDDMYAEYKAGRAETPEEFHTQLRRIKEVIQAFNIPIITAEGYEADDVIGTLGTQAASKGVHTLILTGDTDTLQLVNDYVQVALANPFGQRMSTKVYDLPAVEERYKGLRPSQLADLRGLKGDTSDNIPGVKGIGEAGAIALLNQFGTVENLYAHLAETPKRYQKHLQDQEQAALFSKQLATIVCNAPVQLDLPAAVLHDYDRSKVIRLFQELEMGATLLKRLPASGSAVEIEALPGVTSAAQSDGQLRLGFDETSATTAAVPVGTAGAQQMAMFDIPTASAATTSANPAPVVPSLGEYRALTSAADLQQLQNELAAAASFAFDTETGGLRALQDELVGISIATTPGHAWYIPLTHRQGEQLPRETVLDVLRPFFASDLPKYAHNAKFDVESLEHAGVPVQHVSFDTMLAAALLPNKNKNLKSLAFYELKLPEPMTDIDELIGKGKNQISFAEVPIERATPYAAADADMTLRLKEVLAPQLAAQPEVEQIFTRLEMPLLPVLVRMEQAGIGVNVPYFKDLGASMGTRLTDLESQIYAIAKRPFNINSGPQLEEVLFGELQLPTTGLSKTATGRYSLTAQVLEDLRAYDTSGILELILQYRQLTKLKSTYVDSLPQLVNPETGRIHTTYSQLGAATGRLSSNDPNLQNIPTRTDEGREIRRGFVAAPGHVFLAADYSQIELRVLAHITQDKNLLQAFEEDQDIHAATASQLFGVPIDQVDRNQRRIAKTTVFGVIYGISAFGLAPRIGTSRTEAQQLIDGLFARFPKIRDYIDQTLEAGARDGYVHSLFGRRRYMPELRSGPPQRRQAAQREAINAPIQATAADIMKLAMINVDHALRNEASPARMLLQVHDELIFELPQEALEATAQLVRREMEGAHKLNVRLKVDMEFGPNWLEMEEIDD